MICFYQNDMPEVMLCDFKAPVSRGFEASIVIFLELTCWEETLANEQGPGVLAT